MEILMIKAEEYNELYMVVYRVWRYSKELTDYFLAFASTHVYTEADIFFRWDYWSPGTQILAEFR